MGLLESIEDFINPMQAGSYTNSGYNIQPYSGYAPAFSATGIPGMTSPTEYSNTTGNMGLSDMLGLAGGLGQMYLGFQQYGLLEDVLKGNLSMAKEKQGWTRDELNRINKVRNNLNSGYQTGNYGVSPTAVQY